MKTKLFIGLAFVAAISVQTSFSQAASPAILNPVLVTGTVSNSTAPTTVLGQLELAGEQGYQELKTNSFADGFSDSPLLIYQSGNIGFVDVITTDVTNAINYGFFLGGMEQNHSFHFYDGGVALTANGTYTLPIVGTCQLEAAAGGVIDLAYPTSGVYSEDTATAYKQFFNVDSGNIQIGATFGTGYSTEWANKPFYVGGLTITDHLKGKGFLGLF